MKTISLKDVATMGRTAGALGALVWALSGSVAHAGTQCYDFSGPAVGTTYHVGDTVNTRHSVINLQRFRTTNGPSQSAVQQAEIVNSNLPQAGAPSLKMTSIVTQVVPQKPVREVTLKYAENPGHTGRHDINFGVNGQRRVWHGRLARLDGAVMGDRRHGGKVKVSVTANRAGNGSYWVRGTLKLQALPSQPFPGRPNGIARFALGEASQLLIDKVCLTR